MNSASPSQLLLQFALYSLLAVGGANALLPEIHHDVVTATGWLSDAEFSSLFAIAQAAPGPNVLVVTLIGWKLAGFGGAVACTVGMCGPSAVLAWQAGRLWQRFQASRWRRVLEQALAPVSAGLVLGSGTTLVAISAPEMRGLLIASSCAVACFASRRNPLWWLALAAAVGGTLHVLHM